MTHITQKQLKELLHYNPETGIFTWRIKPCRKINVTDVVGTTRKDGYLSVTINYKPYLLHRLALLYMTGKIPPMVDHDNRNTSDNRFSNLNESDIWNNSKNCKPNKSNTSGVMGVYWCKERESWEVKIGVNSKKIHIGRFKDKDDAIKARKEAEVKYNFHPNHGK